MFRVLVLAAALAFTTSCATTTASQVAASPLVSSGVSALATQLGIDPTYVSLAMTAAQTLLGQGKDQAAAVGGAVDEAAAKAKADGKAFTTEQMSGLAQGITGMLKK